MSRTDHYMGLNKYGRELVEGKLFSCYTETITREFLNGRIVTLGPFEVEKRDELTRTCYDTIDGAFGNEYPLFEYTYGEGKVLYEYVQKEIWKSGPMFFIALKDVNDKPIETTLWTDKEIADECR